jgi:putative ubiquitin-RnfH superfamily antitoxin RatB of RatAB toxin-antitoxin module
MDHADDELLTVQVVYSPRAGVVDEANLRLPQGSRVEDAIRASGMLARHAAIDLTRNKVGVWGKWRGLDDPLRDNDRVEIYRPLLIDPKEARRLRQRRQRAS